MTPFKIQLFLAPSLLLATAIDSSAQEVSYPCGQDIGVSLDSLFFASYPTEDAKSVVDFKADIQALLEAKCDAKMLSKEDLRAIIDGSENLMSAYLGKDQASNTTRSRADRVQRYVNFGLVHAANGQCRSDVGSPSALEHCVCTAISINETIDMTERLFKSGKHVICD